MKKLLTICAAAGLILAFSGLAIAGVPGDLFNDGDRTTVKVRADDADDYAYVSATLYPNLKATVADGWKSVSLPFAGNNKDNTPFDVVRDRMETMRFYFNCKDSRYNDLDDPHIQIDNVKLTKTGLSDLVIDNFDDGNLRWSYQQHPAPSSPPGGVSVSLADVTGKGKVLDIHVTDMDARDFGPNWEMNYIDIFTCLTNDASDSFIYGDDWSAYDNLEFEWQVLDPGTRRDYIDLYVRTDVLRTVYVDDDYTSSTPGWDVTHFNTIQGGINAVGTGGTVYVLPGTYPENLTIPKSLTLSCASGGGTTVYPATSDVQGSAPTKCEGPSFTGSQMVVVQADDVTIEHCIFDGNNPNISSGETVNGVDIDARNGIIVDYPSGDYSNLEVRYCTVKNIFLRAIYPAADGSGHHIHHNTIDNADGCDGQSTGVMFYGASGTVNDNTISRCKIGIMYHQSSDGDIIENTVSDSKCGIAVNGNDAPTKVCYNTVTNAGEDGAIQAVSVDESVDICCNEVTGDSDGIIVYGGHDESIEIFDNKLTGDGNHSGLLITTDLTPWGSEDSTGVDAWGNTITNYDKGVEVDSPIVGNTVTAMVKGNNISGNVTWGAENSDAGSTLDATNNWWGSPTGPKHATGNPGGTGDNVSDNVLYNPWAQALVVLDPWRTELHECEEVMLDVKVRANNMYGIQFIVHFDPTNLQVTDAGWTPDPFYPDQIIWDAVVDNVGGTVKFAATQRDDMHSDPVTLMWDEVAYVTFHCIGPSYDHIWLEELMLGEKEEGMEIPSTYTSACIKNIPPEAGSITGQVDLQGRTDEKGAIITTSPGGYWSASDSAGNYTISNVPPGTYTVNPEMTLYLDSSKSGVVVNTGATTTLSQVRLLGGDCNDSEHIEIHDATIIGSAFGSVPTDSNWDPRADINADGKVNILDAVILGGNWDKCSPVSWP